MIGWGELAQLEWRAPWWGLLALQPLAMALAPRLRRRRALRYAEGHLLPWAVREGAAQGCDWGRKAVLFAACALLAAAAAGPRLPLDGAGPQGQARLRHGLDVMVLLDVSPSMLARDVSPQRLVRAKLELLDLLDRLHGERLGLIAFSGTAGLLMPPSRDYGAFRYYLGLAGPGLFATPGTDIAAALDLARRKLGTGPGAKAVLLLSDGEASALSGPAGAAAGQAAERLKAAGIPLYFLGLGSEAGAPVGPGATPPSRMDAAAGRELAGLAGGRFAPLSDGPAAWRTLYDRGLLALPAPRQGAPEGQAWRELYPWLLAPALLLFWFISFPLARPRPGPGAAAGLVLLLLTGIHSRPGVAAEEGAQAAYAAWLRRDYPGAQALYARLAGYAARMGEGAAAYRRRDYGHAAAQFTEALLRAGSDAQRADALFDLGDARYQAGDYQGAADAFQGVLRYRPGDPGAGDNLALAAGKLAQAARSRGHRGTLLGRLGHQTGGTLGADIRDRPVTMAPDKEEKGPMAVLPEDGADYGQARQRPAGAAGIPRRPAKGDTEKVYRAALKKLDLLADRPQAVERELIKQDTPDGWAAPQGMAPW